MSSNRFVAFLDVLGFKDLVERNHHSVLDEIFTKLEEHSNKLLFALDARDELREELNEERIKEQLVEFLKNKIMTEKKLPDGVDLSLMIRETVDSEPEWINRIVQARDEILDSYNGIEMLSVSDSIFIWSKDDSSHSFSAIIRYIQAVLGVFMLNGVPLRGALTHGPITVRDNAYKNDDVKQRNVYGKAIVDAYTLEGKQQWSGCIVSDKCAQFINERFKDRIVKYQVPQKSGPIDELHVINWTYDIKQIVGDGQIIPAFFADHNKNINHWSVKVKIDNTVKFYQDMLSSIQ